MGGARFHALERRPWLVVAPADPRPDPRLLDQLDRRQTQVLQEAQVLVQRIDRGQRRVRVVPDVAEELPHVRPILLFDVGVVVLLVRAPTRELDVLLRAVAAEMVIDEFRPIVGIDPLQAKRQLLPHVVERLLDDMLALAHDGARFHPGRVDVGQVQRVHELAVGAIAGMRDQVDLGEAGDLDVPAVGLQRNLVLQERPRLRPAVLPFPQLLFERPQGAIHLAWTHPPQSRGDVVRHRPAADRPRQPDRQQRFQPHRPGAAGGFPDPPQRAHHDRPVLRRAARAAPPRRGRPSQQPDHRLAVIARHLTHLIHQPTLGRLLLGQHIPFAHPRQILSSRLWSHRVAHASVLSWVTRLLARRPPAR